MVRTSIAARFACALLAVAAAASPAAAGLPLMAEHVDASRLPPPYGIGITVYGQTQPYSIDSLSVNVPGFANLPTDDISIDNSLREQNAKFDFWLFPFLNLFGLVGHLEGDTSVNLTRVPLPVSLGTVAINYHGTVYGAGATLAAGSDRWFGSLTTIYTNTDLKGDFESTATAFVVTPKIGLTSPRGSAWIGAMYQRTDEHHQGDITLPFLGSVGFDVKLRQKNAWNGVLGMESALTDHWHLELEGGVGSRMSASVGLTYRF